MEQSGEYGGLGYDYGIVFGQKITNKQRRISAVSE
jgi:hypothetical protein